MTRVVLYPGGRTGVGNAVRLTRLARHIRNLDPRFEFIVLTGHPELRVLSNVDLKVICLEPLQQLLRVPGIVPASVRERIGHELLRRIQELRPDLVLASRLSGYAGELVEAAKIARPRLPLMVGWRDIITDPETLTWDRYDVAQLYEELVIRVVTFGSRLTSQHLPMDLLSCRLKRSFEFLGYIRKPRGSHLSRPAHVICQVGGGRDGEALVDAFRTASGRLMETGSTLLFQSSDGVFGAGRDWREFGEPSPEFCKTLISMGGYNSCVEAAQFGVSSLIFPAIRDADDEQATRADVFAGVSRNIEIGSLEIAHLASFIESRIIAHSQASPLRSEFPEGFFTDPKRLLNVLRETLEVERPAQ
jgi:predicted glycosyltransferase